MNLMIVPKDCTAPDVLAERYRSIFAKITSGREQWIEGTLELAVFMREARIDYPDHPTFSRWLERNALNKISKDERTALLWMADNQTDARELLTQTTLKSWDTIYRRRPQKALRNNTKGLLRDKGNSSGADKRKRRARIPDVMREDHDPPPIKLRSAAPARSFTPPQGLTHQQVDPDFKGTSLEFRTKYGHVNLHTKQEIEHHKHQEALSAWLGAMADHDRSARALLTAIAAVDAVALQEWKRKPGKAEKLRAWCDSIQRACESLREVLQ